MAINNKLWKKAEELTRKKRFSFNYPNIYVQYLTLTGIENERTDLVAKIRRIFEHNVPVTAYVPNDKEKLLSDIQHELDLINNYIEKVKAEYEKIGIDNPDRRSHVLDAIEESMMVVAKDVAKTKLELAAYGTLIEKKSSESDVYVDEIRNMVLKSKNLFSHDAYRPHDPWDTFYEHIAINILFPNVPLHFYGYSSRDGHPSLLFEQEYFRDMREAKDTEIEEYLKQIGLLRENKYYFGNEWLSVTDVFGKNVLTDGEGMLYFIDPNIYFKKHAKEFIDKYLYELKR